MKIAINNLAQLYCAQGAYQQAEPLYDRALVIWEEALGSVHPYVAGGLDNLAQLYHAQGAYKQAEPLYERALTIRERALGPTHPDVATTLDNLAGLYHRQGTYRQAELLHKRALAIRERALGPTHPDVATTLNNLAQLYWAQGAYWQAEPLYKRALVISEEALGLSHPDVATTLNNLALLNAATDRSGEARKRMERVSTIHTQLISQIFCVGSESRRMAYLKAIEGGFHAFLSLVVHHFLHSPNAVQTALEVVMRRKGLSAEALAAQRDMALSSQFHALEPQLRELTTWRRQIAKKTLAGPGPEGLSAHQQQLVEWELQKEQLEAEIARQIPELHLDQQLRAANRQAVAQAMPAGTVLIEVVRFPVFDFQAVPARGELQWQPARYLAFVLHAQEPEQVQLVDLGEAEPIDELIRRYRQTLIDEGQTLASRQGIKPPSKTVQPLPASVAIGKQLRIAVFDRLYDALQDCKQLLLAPDGELTQLPFEVLPLDDSRYLLDSMT